VNSRGFKKSKSGNKIFLQKFGEQRKNKNEMREVNRKARLAGG
jgi:hypothetical protein